MGYPSYMIAPYECKFKSLTQKIVNKHSIEKMSSRQDKEIEKEKMRKNECAKVMKEEKEKNEEIIKNGGIPPKVIKEACFEMKKCYTNDFDNPLRFRDVYVMVSRTKTTAYFKTKSLGSKLYTEPIKVNIKYSKSRRSEYFKDGKHSIICNEPIDWW